MKRLLAVLLGFLPIPIGMLFQQMILQHSAQPRFPAVLDASLSPAAQVAEQHPPDHSAAQPALLFLSHPQADALCAPHLD